jgi:hypothetical protein
MNNNFFSTAHIYYKKIDKITINTDTIELPKSISTNYNIFGVFDKNLKIWYHAWSIYNTHWTSAQLKKSKELLMYALDIKENMNGPNMTEKVLIKSILVNSKVIINNLKIQIPIILSIIAYLSQSKKCIMYNVSDNYIIYIMV